MKEVDDIISWLKENSSKKSVAGMSRFGINTEFAFGVSVPVLRAKAKEFKRRNDIALELYTSGYHEARIMAGMIAVPELLSSSNADEWVYGFDSWDVCDQCCSNLLYKTAYVYEKIPEYAKAEKEFVRRTAFVLIAVLAVHDKKLADEDFLPYLKLIEDYSEDERNFVCKAVNWALRQIGKRNRNLNAMAADVARRLAISGNRSARWIGSDAMRELTSEKTLAFIENHRQNS